MSGLVERKPKIIRRKVTYNGVTGVAKVTAKGQVTIPVDVRKALRINEGDELIFEINSGVAKIRKLTAIDRLAKTIGPKLREAFPTPGDFEAYLKTNRKKIFESIYGDVNDKSSD